MELSDKRLYIFLSLPEVPKRLCGIMGKSCQARKWSLLHFMKRIERNA